MEKILRYFLLMTWLTSPMLVSAWREDTLNRIEDLKRDLAAFEDFDAAVDDQEKVTGGIAVANGEYPFLVSVELNNHHSFTGSVIDATTVLTCAHCLQYITLDKELQHEYDVVIGVHNISKTIPAANKFKIKQFYIHPSYNKAAVNRPVHDIGLIVLDRAIDFKVLKVRAAPLTNGAFLEDYTDCWVAGWGSRSDEIEWSEVPYKYPVTVMVDPTICEQRIRKALDSQTSGTKSNWTMVDGNVCGISDTGNHCQGDSGAPMWCKVKDEDRHVQLALVSTTFGVKPGSKCGVKGGVSIYSGVGEPHYTWIRGLQGGR